jgi:predicted oxidoreductase
MKKRIFLFLLVSIFTINLQAQTEEYNKLILEREDLIKEYNYLKDQNSNFWGKKSKKDLLRIVENLKAIIKKDSEIINNIQEGYVKHNADLTVRTEKMQSERKADTRLISDNITDMKRQVSNLESRDKQRLRRISTLEDQLQEARDKKFEHDQITVLASVLAIIFFGYSVFLKTRKTKNAQRA